MTNLEFLREVDNVLVNSGGQNTTISGCTNVLNSEYGSSNVTCHFPLGYVGFGFKPIEGVTEITSYSITDHDSDSHIIMLALDSNEHYRSYTYGRPVNWQEVCCNITLEKLASTVFNKYIKVLKNITIKELNLTFLNTLFSGDGRIGQMLNAVFAAYKRDAIRNYGKVTLHYNESELRSVSTWDELDNWLNRNNCVVWANDAGHEFIMDGDFQFAETFILLSGFGVVNSLFGYTDFDELTLKSWGLGLPFYAYDEFSINSRDGIVYRGWLRIRHTIRRNDYNEYALNDYQEQISEIWKSIEESGVSRSDINTLIQNSSNIDISDNVDYRNFTERAVINNIANESISYQGIPLVGDPGFQDSVYFPLIRTLEINTNDDQNTNGGYPSSTCPFVLNLVRYIYNGPMFWSITHSDNTTEYLLENGTTVSICPYLVSSNWSLAKEGEYYTAIYPMSVDAINREYQRPVSGYDEYIFMGGGPYGQYFDFQVGGSVYETRYFRVAKYTPNTDPDSDVYSRVPFVITASFITNAQGSPYNDIYIWWNPLKYIERFSRDTSTTALTKYGSFIRDLASDDNRNLVYGIGLTNGALRDIMQNLGAIANTTYGSQTLKLPRCVNVDEAIVDKPKPKIDKRTKKPEYDPEELFEVVFDSNGGSAVPTQTMSYGMRASEPTNPTKTGFTFAGWWLDDSLYNFNTPVTGDITLVAHWDAITYDVTFNSPNAVPSVQNKTYDYGDSVDDDMPIEPIHNTPLTTFKGWYTQSSGGSLYDTSQVLTGDLTLWAQWTPPHTVTFDSDGGTPVASQTVADNGKASAPVDPTKVNYTFTGWYLNNVLYNFNTPVTSDITLVAHWEENIVYHTVTFNSMGGTSVPSQTVQDGHTATRPANPSRVGYSFLGWYNGLLQYDFSTPVISDITLTAHWDETPAVYHTVSFDLNGGIGLILPQSVPDGGYAHKPFFDPVKVGYVFIEWRLNNMLYDFNTPVTSDITLSAEYQQIPPTPIEDPDFNFGNVYRLSESLYMQFEHWLWSADIGKLFKEEFFGNASDAIMTMQYFNFPVQNSGTNVKISCGFVTSDISAPLLGSSNIFQELSTQPLSISDIWNDFRSYSPISSASLYLPYVGFVDVDINDLVESTIQIKYHVNVLNGDFSAKVVVTRSGDMNQNVMYEYSGNCCMHLPVTSADFSALISGGAGIVGKAIGGALTGGIGGAIAGAAVGTADFMTSQKSTVRAGGSLSGTSGLTGCQIPYIVISYDEMVTPSGFSSTFGLPCYVTKQISSISNGTFIRMYEGKIRSSSATQEEIEEIQNMLKEGVYI